MRKLIFTFSMLAFIANASAQDLRKKISGERGLSEHFTTLEPQQQVSFNPNNAKSIFGLDVNSDLVLSNQEPDNLGMNHYRYIQSYKGFPVENSMYIAHTLAGKLVGMSGVIITDFGRANAKAATAVISGKSAITAAINQVHASKYAWEDAFYEESIKTRNGANATYYPNPTLVWFSAEDDLDVEKLTLAYKVDVYSIKPLDRKYIYIDATNGKVLGALQILKNVDAVGTAATNYSGVRTIHSDLNGGTYRLRDLTKGNGIITLKGAAGHADYTNASANWALTGTDKWAMDAHFGVAATWIYFKDNFNRNSIDNNGFALTSWVNDPNNSDNASWDGSVMSFGNRSTNGNGIASIDIAGHELTHGFTEKTSNLVYNREPGAINESISDILGKSVQFYTKPDDINWNLGNDMNWEIRSMSNPNAFNQPDTYQGTYWYDASTSGCPFPFGPLNDNCGVHYNSGVGNFMYYLLVTGGSGTNDKGNSYAVTGIGLAKAGQIIYRSNATYLTSTSKYADWRTACINAATDLYGAASDEVNQVKNAWYAVGVGTAGTTGCTPSVPTGLASTAISPTSTTVSWAAVAGAVSYTLDWKLASSATWTTVAGLTTTSYNLTNLSPSTAYQFRVSSSCGGTTSAYSAAVTFTTIPATGGCLDAYEDNNTLATAAEIPVNTPINGILSSQTDKDYFSFSNTSANPNIKINLSNLPKNYAIRLYKANGVQIGISDNAGTENEEIVYNTTIVGTYKIQVYSNNKLFNQTSCYTLVASIFSSTPQPTCDAPTPSVSNITQTTATISWPAVAGAVSYDLRYKTTAAGFDSTINFVGTSLDIVELTAGTSYQYQVKANCSEIGSAFSALASFNTSENTPTCTDIYEPNNTISAVAQIEVNTPITGIISSATDKDYFKFTNGTAARNIKITLTDLPADYDVKLYAPSGSQVGISENSGTASETIIYNTGIYGIFKLNVYSKSGAFNANNCYTLKAEVSSTKYTLQGANGLIAQTAPIELSENVVVFPQPATGTANLRFGSSWKGVANVAISNQLGMKVGTVNINVDGGVGKLNISNLSAGLYYLRISNGIYSVTQKLLVQK
jgi:Zn-dependent metalloprotease